MIGGAGPSQDRFWAAAASTGSSCGPGGLGPAVRASAARGPSTPGLKKGDEIESIVHRPWETLVTM